MNPDASLTPGDATAPSDHPQPTFRRHPLVEYLLAAVICISAVAFWTWKDNSRPSAPSPTPPAPTATVSARYIAEGLRLYDSKDCAGAEEKFRKAIGIDPATALGYNNLGAALNCQKRFQEAIPILQKAVALDPTFALARNNLKWAIEENARNGK